MCASENGLTNVKEKLLDGPKSKRKFLAVCTKIWYYKYHILFLFFIESTADSHIVTGIRLMNLFIKMYKYWGQALT